MTRAADQRWPKVRQLLPSPDGRVRFTRGDYHRMREAGILGEDDPVELLDGEIVAMPPIGPGHNSVTDKLAHFFIRELGERYICRVQGSLALSEISEPEPDFQILRRREDFYRQEHPGPADVLLLIEVAQSSVDRDREEKMRLYAEAGIPEYWVIELDRRRVIVHRQPSGAEYRSVQHFGEDGTVSPEAVDCSLDLAWLLG